MHRRTRASRWTLAGAALAALSALATIGGCNIVGPVAMLVTGPPKIQGLYELDPARTTTIFIDDRLNHVPQRSLRAAIGKEAETVLIEEGCVEQQNMISSQAAMQAALAERGASPMPITDIGKSVGADIVIYVKMDRWTLADDGVSFKPAARAYVKVIDVAADRRIWPESPPEGYALVVSLSQRTQQAPSSQGDIVAANQALAKATGQEIARIFFTHERPHFQDSFKK